MSATQKLVNYIQAHSIEVMDFVEGESITCLSYSCVAGVAVEEVETIPARIEEVRNYLGY